MIDTNDSVLRREFFYQLAQWGTAGSMLFYAGCRSGAGVPKNAAGPNVVLIFTDDQGYADVGCFGAKGYATPNLDRMADEGMRFTDFHVTQAVCSASRAGLLTGCYPNRISILGALKPNDRYGLNPDEETLAELLKAKGYATGIFGKWHLGHHRPFLPLQQGFDEYFGLPYSNDMWAADFDGSPLSPEHPGHRPKWADAPPLPLIDGNDAVGEIRTLDDQNRLTSLYTERAVAFIEKNKDRLFFLYLPHSMPHVPLGVSSRYAGKSVQGKYGDVMMEIDWSVGQVLEAIRRNGLDDNTLVIFMSDNGPALRYGNHAGSAVPLRGGKTTTWEGGTRIPCIMRWPGRIPAGSVCDQLASTLDILPTVVSITGAKLPKRKIDGVNMIQLMEGKRGDAVRDHFFYYSGTQLQCVRQGRWKLHFPHVYRIDDSSEPGRDGFPGRTSRGQTWLELYDLEADVGEEHNVADQHPDIVSRLQALAETAREDLGDSLTHRTGNGVRQPGRL